MSTPTVVEPIGDYLTTWGSEYNEWGGPHCPAYTYHGAGTIEAYPGHVDSRNYGSPGQVARTVFQKRWALYYPSFRGQKYDNPSYPTGEILIELTPEASVPGLSDGLGSLSADPWGREWWGWETGSFGGHWSARPETGIQYEDPYSTLETSLGDPVVYTKTMPTISLRGLWWRPFISYRAVTHRISSGEILMGKRATRIEHEAGSTYAPPSMWGGGGSVFGALGLSWGGHTTATRAMGEARYPKSR